MTASSKPSSAPKPTKRSSTGSVSGHSSISCEEAQNPDDCTCECRGVAHQSNVLRVAISRKDIHGKAVGSRKFQWLLNNVFGARFTSLSENAIPGKKEIRGGRGVWEDPGDLLSVKPKRRAKWRSQREKRVVDVTLRDALAIVYRLPDQAKVSWMEVAKLLTLQEDYKKYVEDIDKVIDPKAKAIDPNTKEPLQRNDQSAYFWSAILAALSESASRIPLKPFSTKANAVEVDQAIITAINAEDPTQTEDQKLFSKRCYPRQDIVPKESDPSDEPKPSEITEVVVAEAVKVAAEHLKPVATKAYSLNMQQDDFILLVQIVGSVVSADLWHQPAAVRHLLIPAVQALRKLEKKHKLTDWVALEKPGEEAEVEVEVRKKGAKAFQYDPVVGALFALDGETPEETLTPKEAGTGVLPVEDLLYWEMGENWEWNDNWGPPSGRFRTRLRPRGRFRKRPRK
ncbi:MAG: hypothetical protein ACRC20_12290 [Segniliparus sp.]|uniref:hypothetical protein n=1 Tax=Segniliparus sp. TaxID=2804064 RepID=UPI003F3F393F